MKRIHAMASTLSLVVGFASVASPKDDAVAMAAARFVPEVRWKSASRAALDFTCRGREEFALLGTPSAARTAAASAPRPTERSEVVVAVFTEGLTKPPRLLRIADVSPEKARLTVESLDYPSSALKKELGGAVPAGWRRSKTCKGLNLGDGETDSFHIYWHTTLRGFALWQR